MNTLLRLSAAMAFVLAASFAWSDLAAAQNVSDGEAYANVVMCTDAECADLTDVTGMEGAIVTSLDASGAEIDSCVVETFPSGMDGCVITKHAGDGSYVAGNLAPGYALLSEEPEVLESESHGTQLVWYAAPMEDDGEIPAENIRTNVIACVDPLCDNSVDVVDMPGATVSSVDAEGNLVDSCTVALTESDSVNCEIVPAPAGGWYEVVPSAEYADYELLSAEPTVFESEMHGAVYVWYFAPVADDGATPPADGGPVTSLPETGIGPASSPVLLVAAACGLALVTFGAGGMRRALHS